MILRIGNIPNRMPEKRRDEELSKTIPIASTRESGGIPDIFLQQVDTFEIKKGETK